MSTTADTSRKREVFSKDGVRFLGPIPKHKLTVLSKSTGGKEQFQPLVLQPGWFERQCDPEWERQRDAALLDEYKSRIERESNSRCNSEPNGNVKQNAPTRQRLDKYYASNCTQYEHLLFGKDRIPPFAVDEEDLEARNSYNEPMGKHATTYDIAYNVDDRYKHARRVSGTGSNRYSHVDYHLENFSESIVGTNHDAYRATPWLPPEALSKDKTKVIDQLADPFRPAFIQNRFGQDMFSVGCQTEWKFVEEWKKREFPVEDYRDLLASNQTTLKEKSPPQHRVHKLPFDGCKLCEKEQLCCDSMCATPSSTQRNNTHEQFDPAVPNPAGGSRRYCNCLSNDLLFEDQDFSPAPNLAKMASRDSLNRRKRTSEKYMMTKTTQTPSQKDMDTFWAKEEENFNSQLQHAPESYKQKIERERYIITADGKKTKTPFYLLDKKPPSDPSVPYERKVYAVVPPPSDGWSGYIKGPKVPDF